MGWRGVPSSGTAYGTRGGNQAQGYYNGYGPLSGGTGSGGGTSMAGRGALAQGQGVTIGGQEWHPTILYLLALVVVEMVVFGVIAQLLK